MPSREIINTTISTILGEILISGDTDLSPGKRLKEDLGLDSLALISLVFELNNHFNIEIKSVEINPENFATIARLQGFIMKKLEG